MNHSEIVSFLWGVADLIRDTLKRGTYQDVVLPLTRGRGPADRRGRRRGHRGIERDRLESDDKFMRRLAQSVRNGLGDRAGTCIDPKTQIVEGRTVCVVSCQRSPEPVFLRWKALEARADGDFFVRSGPGTVKLSPDSAREYIRTRFAARAPEA